jgi:hypothetical protein
MAGLWSWGKLGGAGADVGTAIVGKYGDDLAKIAIRTGSLTDDAASISKFKSQKIAEINDSVIKRIDRFTKKLNEASPSKVLGMGKTLREQSAKWGEDMAKKLGDPAIAGDITKAMGSKVDDIYKKSVVKGQRNLIGKTVDDVGKAGIKTADDIPSGPLNKFANGTWGAAKNNTGKLIIAGAGFYIWAYGLEGLGGIVKTLENIGFLPDGTFSGFVTFWGKLRGFITVVLFGALILGTFWVMNMVFGAAKTAKGVVDSVSDNIVPDAKPSGA